MRRGKKPEPVVEHVARATVRRDRHGALSALEPMVRDVPVAPAWMTEGGLARWAELIEAIVTARRATGLDSEFVAHFCELAAACSKAWAAGGVPPASHMSELRRLAELLGIAGTVSRGGIRPLDDGPNPFVLIGNGRGPDGR